MPLLNKINTPSEIAKAILWLSSDDAIFITGEILTIDGGQSLASNNYNDYLKLLQEQKAAEGGGMMGALFGGGTQK